MAIQQYKYIDFFINNYFLYKFNIKLIELE